MMGIQVTFTARVARAATQSTSASGITRTRVKVDIPITIDPKTGETSNSWATITGIGETGDLLASLEVGDIVFVEGGMRLDSYDKNGKPAIGINVNAKYVNRVASDEQTKPRTPAMAEPDYRQDKHTHRGERRRERRSWAD